MSEKKGEELLNSPLLNKGTAFTNEERDRLGLHGLLPSHVSIPKQQIERSYLNFQQSRTPISKYQFLMNLLNRNERLFYQFASKHATELLPYIYTPTVGEASVEYSQIYTHRRGFYASYPLMEKMEQMLDNAVQRQIDVLVVTDGERILGLGDQGIGGMAIPIGKLSLYTLFAGVHPAKTLPVILDVGTNNPDHLKNPLYLGWRHPRIRGEEYDRFVDRFVQVIRKKFPKVLLQWEDIGRDNARKLLERYREQIPSFNDDIQGTASVALAAILAASKMKNETLKDQKIVIFGGGSAGTGIAQILLEAFEQKGLTKQDALERIYIVDKYGLIHSNSPEIHENQKTFVKQAQSIKNWNVPNFDFITLEEVVQHARPTVLIGVSAQTGAFSQKVIEMMASYVDRPVILPLSNPTSKVEATPSEIIEWTKGRAIIATGSPFQPVVYGEKTFHIPQCNNVYIFPGVGLGSLASGASQVTEGMFLEAAETLANFSPKTIFPPIEEVAHLSRKIAVAVALQAIKDGVSIASDGSIESLIDERFWHPSYD